jgi:hypothetical protein
MITVLNERGPQHVALVTWRTPRLHRVGRSCLATVTALFFAASAGGCSSNSEGHTQFATQNSFPGTPSSCSGDVYVIVATPKSYTLTWPCSSVYVFCSNGAFSNAECMDAAPDAEWHQLDATDASAHD